MLKGKLTGLRAIEEADLAQLLEWRNRPHFRRYFRESRELNMRQQVGWFERVVVGDANVRMFAIVDLATGELIGACGLCYINWVDRNADFSIYIGKDDLYIDEKFAPDAGQAMLKYGFEELGLHRVWSEIYAFDGAKKTLFNALGFSLDGRHRETHWSEGRWHDSLFYGLLAGEAQP